MQRAKDNGAKSVWRMTLCRTACRSHAGSAARLVLTWGYVTSHKRDSCGPARFASSGKRRLVIDVEDSGSYQVKKEGKEKKKLDEREKKRLATKAKTIHPSCTYLVLASSFNRVALNAASQTLACL